MRDGSAVRRLPSLRLDRVVTSDGPTSSTLPAVRTATQLLLSTARGLSDADVRRTSLLPGWSRAHVLSHLASNAEGGARLLEGVASGVPGWEYVDLDSRAADIEAGSHAPVEMLVSRLETTAQRFDNACAAVSPELWSTQVTWTTGHRNAASEVVALRLFEVEIHHVDLAAGRTIDDWPDELTTNVFTVVVGAFTSRADVPALSIQLDDEDARHKLGHGSSRVVVRGRRAALLAWLLGRSEGHDLRVDGGHALPSIPDLY